MTKNWLRRLWIIPPLAIAIGVLVIAPKMKKPPQQAALAEKAVTVRVIEATRSAMIPRAIGYGTTQAAQTWEAVAEVAGQVAWLSDTLKSGMLVSQGTELLRINDASYSLALTQIEAQLNTLDVKAKTTQASLTLEQRSQVLLQNELARIRKVRKQGALSASIEDETKRNVLKGEVVLQNLKNSLALNEAEREVLLTQKANAELNISYTHLIAPFDMRITEVKVGPSQYASKGQLLFSGDAIDSVEIEARFPIGKLRPLIATKDTSGDDAEASPLERNQGATRLQAKVRLKTATHTVEWDARVDRVAGVVDPQTQTIGVIVVVDKPYEQARPGQRPPLVRNTFVEVELHKPGKGKPVLVPLSAMHQGKLYLVDEQNRLEIRPVKPMLIQGSIAAIGKGLEEGEKIIVSQLIPAVAGMLLAPQLDEKTLKRIQLEAVGKKLKKSAKHDKQAQKDATQ